MTDQEFAEELCKRWSFDDRQQHTHSWHDRTDFITKELPELLARVRKEARLEGFPGVAVLDDEDFEHALRTLNPNP